MLEKEIKFIHDFSNNYIRELGLYFTVDELKSKELHPSLIRYISAEVDYRIFQDRRNLLKNSAFDYSGEKINEYFNLIKKEIKRSKRFSANQIDDLLYQAVEFNANFLMRPKKTLITFFFGSIDILTTVEIKQLLNYLYYYKFLVKIIKSYFKEKNLITISKSEFEKLLEKIDAIGIETHIEELLETAVNSMTDFFNIGMLPKEKIPLVAIDEYLAEKNLTAHRKKLRETFHGDIKQSVLSKDVINALKSVVPEQVESIGIIDNFDNDELVLEKVEEDKSEPGTDTAVEETPVVPESSVDESIAEASTDETLEQSQKAIDEFESEQTGIAAEEKVTEPLPNEFTDDIENEEILSGEPGKISTEFGLEENENLAETEEQGIETDTVTEEVSNETNDIIIEQTATETLENKIEVHEQDILSIKEELEERKVELKDFIDETAETEVKDLQSGYETSSVIDEIESKIEELSDKSIDAEEFVSPEQDLTTELTEEADKALTDLVDADLSEADGEKKISQEEILKTEFLDETLETETESAAVTTVEEEKAESKETQPEETVSEEEKLIFSEFEDYFSRRVQNISSDSINVEIKDYVQELDFYVKPLDKEDLEKMLEHSNVYDSDYMVEKINLAEFLNAESEIPDIGEESTGSTEEGEPEEAGIESIVDEEIPFMPEAPVETEQKPEISEELLETKTSPENGGVSEPINDKETVSDEEVLSIDEDSMLRNADDIDLDELERNSDILNTVMEYETEPTITLEDEFSRLELKPKINISVDDELIAGVVKEKQTRNAVKEFILMNNIESGKIDVPGDDIETPGTINEEKIEQPQFKQIDLDSDERLEIEDIIHSEYMPRIIEVVFDYDMIGAEELMGRLKECSSKEECDTIIDEYCEENNINPSIPEVEVFRSLIARTVST